MKKNKWKSVAILIIGLIGSVATIITFVVTFGEDLLQISSIFIKVLLILACILAFSLLIAFWIKLIDNYIPMFSRHKKVLKESLNSVQAVLKEFKEENMVECKNLCSQYGDSLQKIEKYNRIAGKVKDLVFHLALTGEEYSYDKSKGKDDENNMKYVKELELLEGNEPLKEGETQINKKVYVITNDMCLDIYSEQFNKVISSHQKEGDKKYNTIYKYIIPRGVMVEVPKEMESRIRGVQKRHKIGRVNDNNWPELTLPDIYRFKYFKDYIYEETEDPVSRNKKFIDWTKKRSELFLEVNPEIFKIFGPSPERTIYFHQLSNREKGDGRIMISFFLKSEKYFPSSGKDFKELDMLTIDLEEDHSAVKDIKGIIDDFEDLWAEMKNTNFDYPILNLLDVPFLLEEEAENIWVLTPDLVFDNSFVPIRTLVKDRLEKHYRLGESSEFKYKFIIPYNISDRDIGKHLKVFFKNHKIETKEKINRILEDHFIFVSSNVLAKFSIFGEISLYKGVPKNDGSTISRKNILCFFPPVSTHLYGEFNTESKAEVDEEELDNEFGRSGFAKYADFAVILNDDFTKAFLKHMEIVIDKESKILEGEEINYHECKYDGNKFVFSKSKE